jgi:hypothetical protein
MKIELKIDYDGKPYLELYAGDYGEDTKQDLLELFIREAKRKGIYIKNEGGYESSDTYASIRIKWNKESK